MQEKQAAAEQPFVFPAVLMSKCPMKSGVCFFVFWILTFPVFGRGTAIGIPEYFCEIADFPEATYLPYGIHFF